MNIKKRDVRWPSLYVSPQISVKFDSEECVFDDWEHGISCLCLFTRNEVESLFKKKIIITVHGGRHRLGSTSIDIESIWNREGHQLCRKWVPLVLEDDAGGVVGYVQTCVSISEHISHHDCQKFDAEQQEQSIEKNLVVPVELLCGRKLAVHSLYVYRAEGIPSTYNKLALSVRAYLAGIKAETSISCVKNNSVTWNEALIFTEVFPWLHPCIRVELIWQNVVISVLHIDLRILLEGASIFGPKKLHMYSNDIAEAGQLYMGHLLLKFQVMKDVEEVMSNLILPPLKDDGPKELQLTLVGEVHDAILFWQKTSGQPVRLQVSIGGVGHSSPGGFASGDKPSSIACLYPVTASCVGTSHTYMSCSQEDGTVHLEIGWPDSLHSLYRTNHLENVSRNLKHFVESLNISLEQNKSIAVATLQSRFRQLSNDCESYLQAYGHLPSEGNELDMWRQKLHLEELTCLKKRADILAMNSKLLPHEGLFWARKILHTLDFIAEDSQQSLPDVILSLWMDKSRLAYCRIPARQLLYSDVLYERGAMCGIVSSLLMKPAGSNKVAAVVDVKLWLGSTTIWNKSQKWEHFAHSVMGYQDFSLLATIYQAYVMDSKMLHNSYVTVSIRQYSKHTQVQPGGSQARWNESLWFPNIRFDDLPPTVVLELWSRSIHEGDKCHGYALIKPFIGQLTYSSQTESLLPKFSWHNLMRDDKIVGQVFAVFHLQQISDNLHSVIIENKTILNDNNTDAEQHYRLEVLLWGLRDVKLPKWKTITSRIVTIRFAGQTIKHTFEHPEVIQNFACHDVRTLDLVLPRDNFPPIRITVKDKHTMFSSVFRHHSIENVQDFVIQLLLREDFESAIRGPLLFSTIQQPGLDPSTSAGPAEVEEKPKTKGINLKQYFSKDTPLWPALKRFFSKIYEAICMKKPRALLISSWRQDEVYDFVDREARYDWWTKYFGTLAAMQEVNGTFLAGAEEDLIVPLKKKMIKIYSEELEKQPEFGFFFDNVKTFPLTRGDHIVGNFKGALRLYQLPVEGLVMPDGFPPNTRRLSNEPVELLVRVYVVRAIGLAAEDITGSSDPYLIIGTSTRENLVNDRENYIPTTLNPIFGRMFELKLSLPDDYLLIISVMDRDIIKWDDLIGTTSIDIESRYYSRHRAALGISTTYTEDGYMKWRDREKPTDILANLCKQYNIQGPVYMSDKVILGSWDGEVDSEPESIKKEELALATLNQWETIPHVGFKLVPEHVETRMLHYPNSDGKTKGLLQLWVDIFDNTEEIPPEVNIAPRRPEPYELRVTIWDTSDVILHDYSIISGLRSSDIYVLGWIISQKTAQETDIHYRSLTGEGNFNYRLIFNFDFWSAEGKISLPIKNKDTIKGPQKPPTKFPCVLVLEVWDNNHIFRDDRLGILKLNLLRVQRGATASRSCTLETLGPNTPTTDLFLQKRTRGWWPFQAQGEEGLKLTGKIDVELELLPKELAEAHPAGRGRSAPDPLEKPMRPETSFDWIRHPLKALYYSFWLENRRKLLKLLFYALVVYLAFRLLMSIPDIISSFIVRTIKRC